MIQIFSLKILHASLLDLCFVFLFLESEFSQFYKDSLPRYLSVVYKESIPECFVAHIFYLNTSFSVHM